MPTDFQRSKLIMISKKTTPNECEDYRTISLFSYTSKVLARIIHRRILSKMEKRVEDQFGFRKGRGTGEAILLLKLIQKKRLKKGLKTYMTFVDLEKAFHNIEWMRMFKILKEIRIKFKDRKVIWNLYKEKNAKIKIEDKEERFTDDILILEESGRTRKNIEEHG
ncbi:hypothetical protein PGB90_009802 [Kerria lacca]